MSASRDCQPTTYTGPSCKTAQGCGRWPRSVERWRFRPPWAACKRAALVTLPGGAQARVRNPLAAGQGDVVYVQDGAVIGQAPALPVVVIEI